MYISYLDIVNDISLYNIYKNYINDNNLFNFLLIINDELREFIPITSCFRPFYFNPIFYIKYIKYHVCNGNCNLKNGKLDTCYSPPFIKITGNNLEIKYKNTVYDILKNEIMNVNLNCMMKQII